MSQQQTSMANKSSSVIMVFIVFDEEMPKEIPTGAIIIYITDFQLIN